VIPSTCHWCGHRDATRVDGEESRALGRTVGGCEGCLGPPPRSRPKARLRLMRLPSGRCVAVSDWPAVVDLTAWCHSRGLGMPAVLARCIEIAAERVKREIEAGQLVPSRIRK